MKPISIELQAFGPFAGAEKVDFDKISQDGLFLIRGKTGSGKSMIIDAISYALFGKSSGENRDNLNDLRCNRCDPDTDTFVKFTFEEKGTVYMFERSLKKAVKNFNSKAGAYVVKDDGTLDPIFENPKDKEVTRKAEEIIGLSFDQFRQVIILPQGKFEKLLTSTSDDKEKILASIFGTEKWQKIAERYYIHAKAEKDRLDELKTRIDSRLADENCSNMDELKEKLQNAVSRKEEEEKNFGENDYDTKEKLLNEQKELHGEFNTLNSYLLRKEELDRKADSMDEKRRRLEAADKAEPFRTVLEEKKRTEGAYNVRKREMEKAEEVKDRAEERVKTTQSNLDGHLEKKESYEGWKEDLAAFALKKPVYESLVGASEKVSLAEKKHEAAAEKLAEKQKTYDGHLEETEKLYREYDEAMAKHREALDSYMNGIRGLIASELEEGKPCPVCGSMEHPVKASVPDGTVNKDYVDILEDIAARKKENWKNANEGRILAEVELEEKKIDEAQLKSEYEMAVADYNRISDGLVEGINSLDDLEKAMKRLQSDINIYEYDLKQYEDAANNAALLLNAAQTNCWNASEEITRAKEQYLAARNSCEKLMADSEFESAEEAENAIISLEEHSIIADEVGKYEGQLMETEKLVEEKQNSLEGAEEPDISLVNSQLNTISIEREQFNKSQGALLREIDRISDKVASLEEELNTFETEIQKAESNLTFAKSLRGDTGIGLQRYVLGIMFSSVITAANEMLQKVHGGRYRLYRTDETVGKVKKKGLDLKVHDSYSDGAEGRSVSTLSGGEKFLASLALSLGMSAVARTGGVHIEGMFIDEGFGTLDENSVEDALDVLKSIKQMNGSVGIISHMDVLGANIPSQLLVVKEKETSTIRLV